MNRYDAALENSGKFKKEETIISFGFDNEPSTLKNCKNRQDFLGLNIGECATIKIIYLDSSDIISKGKIHFLENRYIFCKSSPQHKEICCNLSVPQNRYICVVYNFDTKNIKYWSFSENVFRNLKLLGDPLSTILLQRTDIFKYSVHNKYIEITDSDTLPFREKLRCLLKDRKINMAEDISIEDLSSLRGLKKPKPLQRDRNYWYI